MAPLTSALQRYALDLGPSAPPPPPPPPLDPSLDQVQYGSVQLAYNWDCCGVDLAYRRFFTRDRCGRTQFRFTFALTNVGAFGNLRRGERLLSEAENSYTQSQAEDPNPI